MMYLLFLISFIIHLLTFILIRQLKEKIESPDQVMSEMNNKQKEMEELLAVYLLEIREENERLESLINQDTENATQKGVEEKQQINEKIENQRVDEFKYEAFKPIDPPDKEDTIEQSIQAKVLSLYENGESIESIAKKLNRGKTEIELYLKFSQKN